MSGASRVFVTGYNPAWPRMFEEERALISAAIGPMIERIEHVGSSAVPGLAAKPTIDIAVAVTRLDVVARCIGPLGGLGYEYVPEYEKELPDRRYFRKGTPGARTHHLHVYEEGHPEFEAYLIFRDHLRANETAARVYEILKRALAATMTRAEYTDAKTSFIKAMLAAAADQ